MGTKQSSTRRIGPFASVARAVVGGGLIVVAGLMGVSAFSLIVGLVLAPVLVAGLVRLRGKDAGPIRLTGTEGHCINCGIIAAAFVIVPIAAALFYGASLLVAAARGYGGCELFALSNSLWRRDDQIACPVFHLLDVKEGGAAVAGSAARRAREHD